jgi:hypothetical protein
MQKKKRITLKRSVSNEKKKRERKKREGSTTNNPSNPLGRPQIYNEMIGAYICRELQSGRTITTICKDKDVPSLPTVLNWLNRLHPNFNEDFFKSYTEARRIQAEVLADQNLDIADSDETKLYTEEQFDAKGKRYWKKTVERDTISARQLKIDTRWKAVKYMAPNKYGSKVELTGKDGGELIPSKPTKVIFNFIKTKEEA